MRSAPAAGNNTCFHVTGDRVNFLIDCGASSLPALKRLDIARDDIDLILITHFHGDHFAGLPFLLLDAQFTRRARPLVIAGPQGIEDAAGAGDGSAVRAFIDDQAEVRAVGSRARAPRETRSFGAVDVTPYPVVHGKSGGPFLAYRIEAEGRVIAYSADTEWTETLIPAGRDADLFIAEAYYYDRDGEEPPQPDNAGGASRPRSGPKRLVLTHMSDDMLGRLETLDYTTASDGMIVEL